MEIAKSYIIQCIAQASENLKLDADKLNILSILKEEIYESNDLQIMLANMKKLTETSKLAVKLSDLYNFITKGEISFKNISHTFSEQSSKLVGELKLFLDQNTQHSFKELLSRFHQDEKPTLQQKEDQPEIYLGKETDSDKPEVSEVTKLKEEFILENEDLNKKLSFSDYKERILKPIPALDKFLSSVKNNKYNEDEMDDFIIVMEFNTELSKNEEFDIITKMHIIFTNALKLLKLHKVIPNSNLVEDMRACLIVIVAIIREKNVDITEFLVKAERLGSNIVNLNKG